MAPRLTQVDYDPFADGADPVPYATPPATFDQRFDTGQDPSFAERFAPYADDPGVQKAVEWGQTYGQYQDENPLKKLVRSLTGWGVPRQQTWPEQVVRSGFSLPRDVMTGEEPTPLSYPGAQGDIAAPIPDSDRTWIGRALGLPVVGAQNPLDRLVARAQDTTALAGSGALPMAEKNALGIFGGKMSKTADLGALKTAEQLEAMGVHRDDIWQATGWGKNAAGQWFNEIPDNNTHLYSAARDIIKQGKPISLGRGPAFGHEDLYAGYPEARDWTLHNRTAEGTVGTQYPAGHPENPVSPGMSIGLAKQFPPDMRSTLLHEVQHGVQDVENFPRGGTPQEFRVSQQTQDLYSDLAIALEVQKQAERRGVPVAKMIPEIGKGFQLSPQAEALARHNDTKYLQDTFQNLKRQIELSKNQGQEGYRRLAGEVEARAVQKREKMTPEERRQRPPWYDWEVPQERQIVRGLTDQSGRGSVASSAGGPTLMSDTSQPGAAIAALGKTAVMKEAEEWAQKLNLPPPVTNLPAVIPKHKITAMPALAEGSIPGVTRPGVKLPDFDRRSFMRGAASLAANASRLAKVAGKLGEKTAKPFLEENLLQESVHGSVEPEFMDSAYDFAGDHAEEVLAEEFYNKNPKATEEDFDKFQETEEAQERYSDLQTEWLDENGHDYMYENNWSNRQYDVMPGGDNYREVNFKLPERGGQHYGVSWPTKDRPSYAATNTQGHAVKDGFKTEQEARQWIGQQADRNRDFYGFHDEPNVLVQARLTDRNVPGVGKTLHVEDLGSEWHQKGNQRGYGGSRKDTSKWTAEKGKPNKAVGNAPYWEVKDETGKVLRNAAKSWAPTAEDALAHARKEYEGLSLVPDAPFKDTWTEVGMRRVIARAVREGYDGVSFTPAKQRLDHWSEEAPVEAKARDDAMYAALKKITDDHGGKLEAKPVDAENTGVGGKAGTVKLVKIPVLRLTPELRGTILRSDTSQPGAAVSALSHSNAPAFYSAVEHALNNAKTARATPEQWLGYLKNQPGVKAEELAWMGLDDAKALGDKPMTREQMLDHVREHGVQVKEVEKKGETEVTEDAVGERAQQIMNREHPTLEEGSEAYYRYFDNALRRADDELRAGRDADDTIGGPKFSEYQLPGGENYRETLFTLPEKKVEPGKPVDLNTLNAAAQDRFGRTYFNLTPREVQMLDAEGHGPRLGGIDTSYHSSHWDEPNVLAHVRMNDRDVPGVGKTLHLEEVQSDWHQEGRKQGYKTQEIPDVQVRNLAKIWVQNEARTAGRGDWIDAWDRLGEPDRQARLSQARSALMSEHGGVPDAPFKTTWPDLVLKRMVRKAAEEGYDAVSWTPGEQQAARYDLSKQVSKVTYDKNTQRLMAWNHLDQNVLNKMYVPVEKIEDYIGKEAAKKIIEDPSYKHEDYHELKGLDLKVGGEGMKSFYDKMLVDKANAIGKKFGGKVEWKPLGEEDEFKILSPEDQGLGSKYFSVLKNGKPMGASFKTREEAQALIDRQPNAGATVPVLRLTPKLKETALGHGFPLFSGGRPLVPVNHNPFDQDESTVAALQERLNELKAPDTDQNQPLPIHRPQARPPEPSAAVKLAGLKAAEWAAFVAARNLPRVVGPLYGIWAGQWPLLGHAVKEEVTRQIKSGVKPEDVKFPAGSAGDAFGLFSRLLGEGLK